MYDIDVVFESVPMGLELVSAVRAAVEATLDEEGVENGAQVCITITSDLHIRELNKKYRDIDKPTDVLSFPMEYPVLGDIVISLKNAQEQADSIGHSLLRELSFLATHGTLHLLGYDHHSQEDEAVMIQKQQHIMMILGL